MSPQGDDRPPKRPKGSKGGGKPDEPKKPGASGAEGKPEKGKKPEYTVYGSDGAASPDIPSAPIPTTTIIAASSAIRTAAAFAFR